MAEFRIVPTRIGDQDKYEVQRAHRVLFWTVWGFECFASGWNEAERAIAHLGGPIRHVTTEATSR